MQIPAALLLLVTFAALAGAQDCVLERQTIPVAGTTANGDSRLISLSGDGRWIAFGSSASNLVVGDSNQRDDCFVRDTVAGVTERVSLSSSGVQGNGHSWMPRITPDGRHVVFLSWASNLDPADTDTIADVYIHDRVTRSTRLVSQRLGSGPIAFGCTAASPTDDGRQVLFDCSDGNVLPGVLGYNTYIWDGALATVEVVSVGPNGEVVGGASIESCISGDGRFVAFTSPVLDWFPHGPAAQGALYLRDLHMNSTSTVTVARTGLLADGVFNQPSMSASGRYLVFTSTAANLLPPSEPHGIYDIVRWDRLTKRFTAATRSPTGSGLDSESRNPSISGDGSKVVYYTYASNATTYLAPYTQIVLADMDTGASRLLCVNDAGDVANAFSDDPAISADGLVTAFVSKASNLVSLPGSGVIDVYTRTCNTASPMVYCTPVAGATGCTPRIGSSGLPSASAASGFELRATGLPSQAPALFFYGSESPWGAPLFGSWLCIQSPLYRTPAGASGGSAACDGTWKLDFNAFLAGSGHPALPAGSSVYVQAWSRNPTGAGQLSDALAFVLEP